MHQCTGWLWSAWRIVMTFAAVFYYSMLKLSASSDITDVTQSCCLHCPCYLTSVTSSAHFHYLIPRRRFLHKCKISLATGALCHGNCVCGDKMRQTDHSDQYSAVSGDKECLKEMFPSSRKKKNPRKLPPPPPASRSNTPRGCSDVHFKEALWGHNGKKKKKKQTRFKKLNRNTWRVVNKWQITGLFVFVLKDQLPGKWELMEREVEVVWVTQLKVSLGSILCFSLLNTCWRLFSVLGVQSEAHSFLRYIENFHPSRCGRVIPREWSLLTLMARSDGFRLSVSITVACSYICKVSPPSGWIVTALMILWLFIYSVFTWVSPKLWYTTRSFKTNDIPASFEFSANCQRWGSKW